MIQRIILEFIRHRERTQVERQTLERKQLSAAEFAAAAAVVGACLSGLSLGAFVWLTLRTDATANRALDVARRQVIEMQYEKRPMVTISAVKISPTRIQPIAPGERGKQFFPGFSLVPVAQNSGDSPTRHLRYVVIASGCGFGMDNREWKALGDSGTVRVRTSQRFMLSPDFKKCPTRLLDPPRSPQDPDGAFREPPGETHAIIGPHASVDIGGIDVTTAFLDLVTASGKRFFIFGSLRYDNERAGLAAATTKFCYAVGVGYDDSGRAIPTTAFCDHWNCADEECADDRKRYDAEVAVAYKD